MAWTPLTADKILQNPVVITLKKRPERLRGFIERFNEATRGAQLNVFFGFDGARLTVPPKWETTSGAFGCGLAHAIAQYRVLSDAPYLPDDPLLFFEDDAVFCENFYEKLEIVASIIPQDWELFYLGGELLLGGRPQPVVVAVKDGFKIIKPYNCNRLHAYVVRAKALPKLATRLLEYSTNAPKTSGPSGDETCFDYEVGRMTERGELVTYAASPFIVGQGAFGSDTYPNAGADKIRFWN